MLNFHLALRNIFRHKARSIVTLAAIACGCVAVIFVGGYFDDTFFKMREAYIHNHSGHIRVTKKGYARHGRIRPYAYLIDNPNDVIAEIQKIPAVKVVTSRLRFSGLISDRDRNYPCLGEGVVPEERTMSHYTNDERDDANLLNGGIITAGEKIRSEEIYEVMLGQGLAQRLQAKVGQGLVMMASTVGGSFNALDVIVRGIFYSGKVEYDDYVVLLPLETAQNLLRTDQVQSLFILLDKTKNTNAVVRQIEERVKKKGWDLEVLGWREMNEFYVRTENMFNRIFAVLKFIVVVILILGIYNTMTMSVRERIPEMGTLMALGTKRRQVIQLFLAEGFLLGIIGGLGGLVVGSAFTWGISSIGIPMPPPPGANMTWISEPTVVVSSLGWAFFLAVAASCVSAWLAASQGTKGEIAEALRHAN